jgi:thiamine-phosphate pyrophosphorylase
VSRAEETLDTGEAGCELLLISPKRLEPEPFARQLADALAQGGVAGFVLRLEAGVQAIRAAAAALAPVCAAHAVAFILQDDLELALELGADGLHLGGGVKELGRARAALGRERILGVSCGASRHAAMLAGEQDADYIAFGVPGEPPDPGVVELVRWWSELFVLPCLAEADITTETCAPLVGAGADFIAGTRAVWQHPNGPAQGVRALRQVIDQALAGGARGTPG